jgi:hypothetical protein
MVLTDLGHPAQQHYLNEDQEILQQAQVSALHSPGKAPSYSHSYLLWLCPHFVGQWDAAFQTEKLGILHSACNSGFVSAIYSCVLVLFPPEHLSYAPDSLALFVWLWFPYTGDADTSLLIFWLHLRVVCMCVGMCMPQCTFGGHRKTCGSWFFFYHGLFSVSSSGWQTQWQVLLPTKHLLLVVPLRLLSVLSFSQQSSDSIIIIFH